MTAIRIGIFEGTVSRERMLFRPYHHILPSDDRGNQSARDSIVSNLQVIGDQFNGLEPQGFQHWGNNRLQLLAEENHVFPLFRQTLN